MKNTLILCTLVLCLCAVSMHAQTNQSWAGFGLEGSVMVGNMIRHNSRFTGPLPERCYSADLNFIKQTYGQKDWQQRRNYPQLGLGLYY
ncbi:MAG: hypothetical protein EOP49_46075, partial [Sphingobacteriales bacterium]